MIMVSINRMISSREFMFIVAVLAGKCWTSVSMVLRKRTTEPPPSASPGKLARMAAGTAETGHDPVGLSGMNAPVLAEIERCLQALQELIPNLNKPLEAGMKAFNKAAFKKHAVADGVYKFSGSIAYISLPLA